MKLQSDVGVGPATNAYELFYLANTSKTNKVSLAVATYLTGQACSNSESANAVTLKVDRIVVDKTAVVQVFTAQAATKLIVAMGRLSVFDRHSLQRSKPIQRLKPFLAPIA